jgi:hypothetical protein
MMMPTDLYSSQTLCRCVTSPRSELSLCLNRSGKAFNTIVVMEKAVSTAFLRKGLPIARRKRLDGNTLYIKFDLGSTAREGLNK